MKINLYNDDGRLQVVLPSPGLSAPPIDDDGGIAYHQRRVYAILGDLAEPFAKSGITASDYWQMIASEFSQDRYPCDLKVSEWARLGATLNAARREPDLFNRLVRKVKNL